MSIDSSLNGEPVLEASVHFPMSGAWSAEIQVAAEDAPDPGQVVTFSLAGTDFVARVTRAGIEASRSLVRLTGGAVDWSEARAVKHYRNTDVGQVLSDLGVSTSTALDTDLPFWTRNPGTTGSAVQAIAKQLGVNWRVLPNGTVRLIEEAPAAVDVEDAVETARDPGRGVVTVAVEDSLIQPGVLFGDDSVGDVTYELRDVLRCRYYTQGRARIRDGLERIIRWVMRDTLFLGQYTAQVASQNADGSLDLLPDDLRLRSEGLQSVPIRHGLPGVTVEVPTGERVLLGFDGGDPTQPYAALWHEGQVTKVFIGGTEAVSLASLCKQRHDTIQAAFDAHIHITTATPGASATPGVIAPTATPIGPLGPVASDKLFTE
jgi:hypothetical protein